MLTDNEAERFKKMGKGANADSLKDNIENKK